MDIPRMKKEELRKRLHTQTTEIIDVRRDKDKSTRKIEGARLHDPDKVEQWVEQYFKKQPLVLYCS